MVHKTSCLAVFFYYYILLFFTVSTQNSFTKIKSVLRFLAVCRTVLGGRKAVSPVSLNYTFISLYKRKPLRFPVWEAATAFFCITY